jgi:hypothetical protein
MVKGVGAVFGDLVSWIEGNVAADQQVLFVPNEQAGTNLLGMALAYHLRVAEGGKLDILALTEPYRHLTLKNAALITNFKGEPLELNLIDQVSTGRYDLLVV